MKLDDFEYELLKFIKSTSMINNGDRVMLAVSGGADSVAMMYALSKIKKYLGAEFFVVHLNHMIRPEAVFEGEGVKKMAREVGMDCFVESRNVPEYIKNHKGLSLEEGARIVRYEFFEELASRQNANKIATAHHLSDKEVEFYFKSLTEKEGRIFFSKSIEKADDLILSELFKMVFKKLNLYISSRKINSCVNMVLKNRNGELNLGKGIYFSINGEDICFGPKKENSPIWNEYLELSVPGEVKIRELSVKIYCDLKSVDMNFGDGKNSVTLEAENIRFPLVVRPLSDSEKIVPFGMKKEVKVRDILKNHRVSSELRKMFPVVSQIDGKIVWVVGMTFPDDLRITGKTKRVLSLIREGGVF